MLNRLMAFRAYVEDKERYIRIGRESNYETRESDASPDEVLREVLSKLDELLAVAIADSVLKVTDRPNSIPRGVRSAIKNHNLRVIERQKFDALLAQER